MEGTRLEVNELLNGWSWWRTRCRVEHIDWPHGEQPDPDVQSRQNIHQSGRAQPEGGDKRQRCPYKVKPERARLE